MGSSSSLKIVEQTSSSLSEHSTRAIFKRYHQSELKIFNGFESMCKNFNYLNGFRETFPFLWLRINDRDLGGWGFQKWYLKRKMMKYFMTQLIMTHFETCFLELFLAIMLLPLITGRVRIGFEGARGFINILAPLGIANLKTVYRSHLLNLKWAQRVIKKESLKRDGYFLSDSFAWQMIPLHSPVHRPTPPFLPWGRCILCRKVFYILLLQPALPAGVP